MPVLTTPTDEVLKTAGMDAVMMLRSLELGVQLFLPMALVSAVTRTLTLARACTCILQTRPRRLQQPLAE